MHTLHSCTHKETVKHFLTYYDVRSNGLNPTKHRHPWSVFPTGYCLWWMMVNVSTDVNIQKMVLLLLSGTIPPPPPETFLCSKNPGGEREEWKSTGLSWDHFVLKGLQRGLCREPTSKEGMVWCSQVWDLGHLRSDGNSLQGYSQEGGISWEAFQVQLCNCTYCGVRKHT